MDNLPKAFHFFACSNPAPSLSYIWANDFVMKNIKIFLNSKNVKKSDENKNVKKRFFTSTIFRSRIFQVTQTTAPSASNV